MEKDENKENEREKVIEKYFLEFSFSFFLFLTHLLQGNFYF